jgi:hypothetical protein
MSDADLQRYRDSETDPEAEGLRGRAPGKRRLVDGGGERRRAEPGKATLTEQLPASSPAALHRAAAAGVAGSGQSLPHLDAIQRAFGRHDVTGVRAHADESARAATAAVGAEAYAMGDHVAFGEEPSLHVAAHEAAHVVQQRGGVQLRGGVGQAGDAYERHAESVAEAVVGGQSAEGSLDQMSAGGGGSTAPAIQLFDRHHATGPAGKGPNTVDAGAAAPTHRAPSPPSPRPGPPIARPASRPSSAGARPRSTPTGTKR